jgi:RNA polymerase sigma factor (sigma-70 family)
LETAGAGDNRPNVATPGALSGAAARQAHAAEVLFTRYRDQIYRFCYARLRSREEAEDATQNVFMRVHMALKRGVVPEYEASWLYKIAHNVCLSRGASTSRRARLETPHAFDEDDDVQVAANDVSHEELAGLSDALYAMPENMRKAILLREWQGLSYAEIADAMGLTVSAVETLLFRARRHLAAALEQGTPTPKKRRLAGWFTLPTFLRRLLSATAPAKLAAGAALVALTGGGVGLGVSVAHFSAPGPHGSAPAPRPGVTFLAGVHAPAAVAPAARHARKRQRRSAPAHAHVAGAVPIVAVAPSIAPVAAPAAPTVSATAQPQAPLVPASSTPQPAVPAAAVAAVPAVPAVPTVQTPAVSTPAATVTTPTATVTVPSATVPSVAVSAPLPAVSIPVVTLP